MEEFGAPRDVRKGAGLLLELGGSNGGRGSPHAAAVPPLGLSELRASNDDVGGGRGRRDGVLHGHMDAGTQAEDQPGVGAVQDEVAAGEQHLAWGRHSGRHGLDSSSAVAQHSTEWAKLSLAVAAASSRSAPRGERCESARRPISQPR